MQGIVFTKQEKIKLYKLINQFYNGSSHGSFKKFQSKEKRNIVLMPIKGNLFVLSFTFLNDTTYADLKKHILNNMEFRIRTIKPDEILPPEI